MPASPSLSISNAKNAGGCLLAILRVFACFLVGFWYDVHSLIKHQHYKPPALKKQVVFRFPLCKIKSQTLFARCSR